MVQKELCATINTEQNVPVLVGVINTITRCNLGKKVIISAYVSQPSKKSGQKSGQEPGGRY